MSEFFPKIFESAQYEGKVYSQWEKAETFLPKGKGKPYCIIMPPPNANESLHAGHVRFVTIEDILIRYHRMKGQKTLWLPGADHAGIETQYVFEKKLAKEGKSRFDFDRETLYQMIWNYVNEQKGNMESQLRALGASCDWQKNTFTLDKKIIPTVYQTFKQLHRDGLLYRGNRLVNYCTKCGTAFSNLEVEHVIRKDPLYYMKYGPFVLATVRPETKFGDTAVAVHPNDKRYQKYIGQEITVQGLIGPFTVKVIADKAVDPAFGTGVVKVTPAHDFNDFEMARRHQLQMKQVIGLDGRLNKLTGKYAGLKVAEARKIIVDDLQNRGLMVKIDNDYEHALSVCYKCKTPIEPLPIEQWFIKMKPLAERALRAIKNKEVVFPVKRFEKISLHWLKNIEDWNISRQIVWGIRIPAWQCVACQKWVITDGKKPTRCQFCGGKDLRQDTDTFDTWFSSGQWPFATLMAQDKEMFKTFYPTSVMETAYDILFFWVLRMIMLGLYATKKTPFKTVVIHGLVRDAHGVKMSKSKGNVINPLEMVLKYGADALRMSMIWGGLVENDINLDEQKIKGQRNFANKLWNIGRFLFLNTPKGYNLPQKIQVKTLAEKKIIQQLKAAIQKVNRAMESYKLNAAAETLYEFIWHKFADIYLEGIKKRDDQGMVKIPEKSLAVAYYVFCKALKLTHPFMPFVTETVWQKLPHQKKTLLINESWPKTK
jgi:valyl-tRNA synthetase